MDLLHSPGTTLSGLPGLPDLESGARISALTPPGIPTLRHKIVNTVQKTSATAEAARVGAGSAHTEAKAARAEAEAARAEAAKAKQRVRSLEAKLDVQRDSSMGPEGGLHARREMPKSK